MHDYTGGEFGLLKTIFVDTQLVIRLVLSRTDVLSFGEKVL